MEIQNVLVDRGYRGKKRIGETRVEIPGVGKISDTYYQKQKAKKKFRQRAGLEPVIGHLKQDHNMMSDYLKGTVGDAINTMMAAAGYNLKHWLNEVIFVLDFVSRILTAEVQYLLTGNLCRQIFISVGVKYEK